MLSRTPLKLSRRLITAVPRHGATLHTGRPTFEAKEKDVSSYKSSSDHSVSVFERLHKEEPKAVTLYQKTVANTKTSIYAIAIVLGAVGFLSLMWSIVSEAFSSVSPSNVFKMALKKIKNDARATAILGDTIKGFGDTHSRTRKRLEHQVYEVAGTDYLRVNFHVEGNKRHGVVLVDLKNTKKGWKTRYIIVKLEGFPPGKITIEDNRHETDCEDLPEVDYSDIAFEEDQEK